MKQLKKVTKHCLLQARYVEVVQQDEEKEEN